MLLSDSILSRISDLGSIYELLIRRNSSSSSPLPSCPSVCSAAFFPFILLIHFVGMNHHPESFGCGLQLFQYPESEILKLALFCILHLKSRVDPKTWRHEKTHFVTWETVPLVTSIADLLNVCDKESSRFVISDNIVIYSTKTLPTEKGLCILCVCVCVCV